MKEWKNEEIRIKKGKHKTDYIKNRISLDIETTSVNEGENKKFGFMYIWQIGIDDEVYYGRTYEELKNAIDYIKGDKNHRVVIYVHNLPFEFQFLRNILKFDEVFARQTREVIKCKSENIEFRCSYALTGIKLENIPKRFNLKTQKLSGDLDYSKIRNSKTPLTDEELKYCENDCLIVNELTEYMLNKYKKYSEIPLTFTGETRKELKKYITDNYRENKMFSIPDWRKYVGKMTPTGEQFRDLIKCFAGGYTHANMIHSNKIVKNVHSVDFNSSYIYAMLSEKYPTGRFFKDYTATLDKLDINNKAYILKLKFYNIRSKGFMNFISYDKCDKKETRGFILDNGRVDCAEELLITVNEQDYLNIIENYEYDNVELLNARSTKKEYLPKVFIEFVINKYIYKNELKEKLKKEPNNAFLKSEYELAKSSLNSLYGMCVMCLIHDTITFEDEWKTEEINDEEIDKQLKDMWDKSSNLLPYSWGVWISAYARRNIWININKIDYDVVYVDTDSIKYINNHDDVINEYNDTCKNKIKEMCKVLKIKYEKLSGLGEFDREGDAIEFKTLGAKKYCYTNSNGLNLTLSGVNKKCGEKALETILNFNNGFIFTKDKTGKNAKFYNDLQEEKEVVDFLGNKELINQQYGICVFPVEYKLSITSEYDEVITKYAKSKILCNL